MEKVTEVLLNYTYAMGRAWCLDCSECTEEDLEIANKAHAAAVLKLFNEDVDENTTEDDKPLGKVIEIVQAVYKAKAADDAALVKANKAALEKWEKAQEKEKDDGKE